MSRKALSLFVSIVSISFLLINSGFADKGAFEQTSNGIYKVNFNKMSVAMNDWASQVLIFERNGDYEGASVYLELNGKIREPLQKDLARLKTAHIPVDIVYAQGTNIIGLKK